MDERIQLRLELLNAVKMRGDDLDGRNLFFVVAVSRLGDGVVERRGHWAIFDLLWDDCARRNRPVQSKPALNTCCAWESVSSEYQMVVPLAEEASQNDAFSKVANEWTLRVAKSKY